MVGGRSKEYGENKVHDQGGHGMNLRPKYPQQHDCRGETEVSSPTTESPIGGKPEKWLLPLNGTILQHSGPGLSNPMTHIINAAESGPLRVRDNDAAIRGRKELQPSGNVATGLLIQSEVMVWQAISAAQVTETMQEDAAGRDDMAGKV